MRNRFVGSILSVVVMSALALGLQAQTAGSSGKARPDLSGIWDGAGDRSLAGPGAGGAPQSRGGVPAAGFTKEEPPMTPSAQALYRARREGRGAAERGLEAGDPSFYPYCIPRQFPRIYNFDPLIEIVQTPKELYMMFETNNLVRRIFLDGKKHLEGWHATVLGTSNGRWDGNTLVVETENIESFDNHGWLDTFGHPYTEALRVTERMTRPAQDTLQIDLVFTDPGAYTKPWTGKKVFQLRTDVDLVETGFCEQRNQEEYLRDIRAGKPRGQPW